MAKKNLWKRLLIDPISKEISNALQADIEKSITQPVVKPQANEETFQFDFPVMWNTAGTNKIKWKPEGRITFRVLRSFSVNYPIARSCIDYVKTKVSKLDWGIVPLDIEEDLDKNDASVVALTDFFHAPMGNRSKYRDMVDAIIEDYLVLGYFTMERLRTKGGKFLGEVKLVDGATIKVLVDQHGRMPQPPEFAFRQFIHGKRVADLTLDELIFVNRNNRTNTVYGLSPIESLIIQIDSAIKGSLSSLGWFSEGNVPEGFGEVPADWTSKQVKEFQTYFDSLLAGNPKYQRRIKMMPQGFNYTPAKKPSEINFQRFELWLMQQTCSVFGVPPSDIGFIDSVNRSTADNQSEKGQERAMRPIVQCLEETFTDIIQQDFGIKELQFKYLDVDPVDKKVEAEIDKIRLDAGVISADEIRVREGMEPIGLEHYVAGKNVTLITELGVDSEHEEEASAVTENEESDDVAERADIVRWRKNSLKAVKEDRPFKKFVSESLDDWMIQEIFSQLQKCSTKEDVRIVFDPYLNGNMQTINKIAKLTNELLAKKT